MLSEQGLDPVAFPTAVGMNRSAVARCLLKVCVPHSRGDEPAIEQYQTLFHSRSPQPWG